MDTSKRSFRQPWGGGKDLRLSIHPRLQTWAPVPSPAIKGRRWGGGRSKRSFKEESFPVSLMQCKKRKTRDFSAVIQKISYRLPHTYGRSLGAQTRRETINPDVAWLVRKRAQQILNRQAPQGGGRDRCMILAVIFSPGEGLLSSGILRH